MKTNIGRWRRFLAAAALWAGGACEVGMQARAEEPPPAAPPGAAATFTDDLSDTEPWVATHDVTTDVLDATPCQCDVCRGKTTPPPVHECPTCCHGRSLLGSKIPGSIRPTARPGNFGIPPTVPGYYSLWDAVTDQWHEKPPKSGYPAYALMSPSFSDADFRYVDALDPSERTWVERFKRIQLGDCWRFGTGGQAWARYMHEQNARLTETLHDFTLLRFRQFGDLSYSDWLRCYGEFLWADSIAPDLPPLPVDIDRGDIQNLFVDVKAFDYQDHGVYVRGGRQEVLLGSQRLISPPDWLNTRRTFEGVKVFRQGDQWDFDAFWLRPVAVRLQEMNERDDNVDLAGAWLTHRPQKGEFLDFYYLYLNNRNPLTQQGIVRFPTEVHTLGSRWTGDQDGYLWDVELALQMGNQQFQDLVAGMATCGFGRHWQDVAWNPTAWIYYDFASGDAAPNAGDFTTFNQLYPFGHYYLGWLDLVGRQNIHDANAHLYVYPAPWITCFVQYHHFWLNQSRDALYNAAGNAIRRDPTGQAGTNG
ncbi:MAG: alginate export family protein [Pirellulales bacterium]